MNAAPLKKEPLKRALKQGPNGGYYASCGDSSLRRIIKSV
ncbi:hypothetical protein CZ787_00950 [Halomonas citrativorans]|uniref:Uncharacterized protein n=1 Tax=Halomonas citrativorans TaxID=2742612 RepID=A0A1R4HPS9_9GAMM|nr:hypothetical protein CZ787_00950 [Halomonas citrativorans]